MTQTIEQTNEDILIAEVIGLDWAADDAIETGLKPDHFQYPENRALFQAIYDQRTNGQPVNATDILSVLQSAGIGFEAMRCHADRISTARTESRTGTSTAYYARKIIAAWRARQHRVSVETMQRDIGHGVDWQEAEGHHQARLDELLQDAGSGTKSFADTVPELIQEMEGLKTPGLKTGFRGLDNALGGARPGNLIVLAGSTGGGKSALGLCIALNVAERGDRICIVSAEMTTAELHERAAAVFSSINPVEVRCQRLRPEQKSAWRAAVERAGRLPIELIDSNRNLNALICTIRASHRRRRFSLVIVDYAQLIQADGHTREREVAQVTQSLKGMAADLQIPVIVLAQLNKELEKREDKRPRLSDLRESMALAHDCNICLMIHRPDEHDPEAKPGQVEVLIRKGRSVDKSIVRMVFRKEFTRFEDASPIDGYDYSNM